MTRVDNEIVWRGFTRPQLDDAYNNSAAVAGSAAKVAEWTQRSAVFRERHGGELDLAYGPRPRNRLDLFRSGAPDAPLLVYIHGGYWQRNQKDFYSCLGEGPLAHGIDMAFVGYTLAPDATMTDIVEEIRAAVRWLRREGERLRVARGGLIVSGWSAGGHLTAMAMHLPEVDAGLAISGVYDVEPCRLNYLNEKLRMTPQEAEAVSPIRHLPQRSGPLAIAYGGDELPELRRQSEDYGRALQAAGLRADVFALAGHDHFSILEELAAADGKLTRMVLDLARR
jgi:acetyl esterase/lipase